MSVLLLLAIAGCASPSDPVVGGDEIGKPGGTPAGEPSVQWNVDYATASHEIFTSIAHLPATLQVDAPDERYLAHATLTAVDKPFAGILKVTFGGWADDVQQTVHLNPRQTSTVPLNPSWHPTVSALTASTPVSLTITLADQATGQTVYADTKPYQLLPPTFFAWYLQDTRVAVFSPVLVTPNAAFVRQVLADAAGRTPWGSIVGYQEVPGYSHDEIVQDQMGAVWDSLQSRGFTYVNAPETYSTTAAQNIKYPATTYDDKTGNCIESVVMMASILEAIGFHTDILLPTSHAFLGVDQWSDNPETIEAVETTMLPSATFGDAMDYANQEWADHHLDSDFVQVSVHQARAFGIGPNPWAPPGNPAPLAPKAPRYLVQNQVVAIPAGTDYHYGFTLHAGMQMTYTWARSDASAIDTGFMDASSLATYESGRSVTAYAWHTSVASISDSASLPSGSYDYVMQCDNSVADCDGTFSITY